MEYTVRELSMRFYLKFILSLFLFSVTNVAFSDYLQSENNVSSLKKYDYYNDVIKLVGPPEEKIVKKTNNEATWIYNNFELYFKNKRLVKAKKLFDRIVLDESLMDETERVKLAKERAKRKNATDKNLLEGIFGGGK